MRIKYKAKISFGLPLAWWIKKGRSNIVTNLFNFLTNNFNLLTNIFNLLTIFFPQYSDKFFQSIDKSFQYFDKSGQNKKYCRAPSRVLVHFSEFQTVEKDSPQIGQSWKMLGENQQRENRQKRWVVIKSDAKFLEAWEFCWQIAPLFLQHLRLCHILFRVSDSWERLPANWTALKNNVERIVNKGKTGKRCELWSEVKFLVKLFKRFRCEIID